MNDIMTDAPLTGVTIVDLSRVLSGPYCTMLAADMGARVIKIEHPVRGDDTRAWGPPFLNGESAYYLSVNRNKESVALDFKTPKDGRALDRAHREAPTCSSRTSGPARSIAIGLGYRDVSARHPRLDLRLDLRLRSDRTATRRSRLRRRRAGRRRADEHHRHG